MTVTYSNYGLPEVTDVTPGVSYRRKMGLEWSRRSARFGVENWRLRLDKKTVARCRRRPDGRVNIELYLGHETIAVRTAANIDEAKSVCFAHAEEVRESLELAA